MRVSDQEKRCLECGEAQHTFSTRFRRNLCGGCYQRWLKNGTLEFRYQKTMEKTAQWQQRRRTELPDSQRDMRIALEGAEKALKRLARQNDGTDYSGALRQCQERIAALSEVGS
jgi:hypothetical protein